MVSSKNDPGYDAAIAAVKLQQGIDRGAASWLADQLYVGRQLVFYWKKSGFPDEIIPRVARLLKMPAATFARGKLKIELTRDDWTEFCAGKSKALIERAKIL